MPPIERYEDLVAWQSASELADRADDMTSAGPAAADTELCKQIRKATAKAPAQIAEGFLRFRPKESAYYYRIARASLGEAQTHLRRGRHRGYWTEEVFQPAWAASDVALKTTTGLLNSRLAAIAAEERKRKERGSETKGDSPRP